jgi:intracellular sulfur oxidation DsrE/DsrF family protein
VADHAVRTFWLTTLLAFMATGDTWAQASEEKPFAEAAIVLQLSDQERESVVLDVANNLIRHYGGPDFVDIEIVTFGPGVRLLSADSKHKTRISSLVKNGVRFFVCENTLATMEREKGHRPGINPHAISVQTGVAYIVERVNEGYVLIRP